MCTLKWNLVTFMLLTVISTGSPASPTHRQQQQKRHVSMAPANQSSNTPPYWDHILREYVFKTISPPPPGNNDLYKHLLDAPFYGGPFPIVTDGVASVVLSRGDVYYLPNGLWLLCQEGCVDCEVCREHTHPSVKWILRRIKRQSSHGSPRYDLQLTILPQIDGSFHMRNLWPRSYVYVTTRGEEDAYNARRLGYGATGSAFSNFEDSLPEQKQGKTDNFWEFAEKNSLPDRHVLWERNNATREPVKTDSRENIGTTVAPGKNNAISERKNNSRGPKRQRTRVKTFNRPVQNESLTPVNSKDHGKGRIRQVIPKLILGTDQSGQKHLVHIVPTHGFNNASLMNPAAPRFLNASSGDPYSNDSAYHRILNRIVDSLSNNRRSIESFLKPLAQTTRTNQQVEEHQQQETRSGLMGLGRMNRFHRAYNSAMRNGTTVEKRWPFVLNWNRSRRKLVNFDNSMNNVTNTNSTVKHNHNLDFSRNKEISNDLNLRSIHPKLSNHTYFRGNSLNNSMIANDITRNSQKYIFGPRKYKLVVTTESPTRSNISELNSDYGKNTEFKRVPLISGNCSVMLDNSKNVSYINLKNAL